VGPRQVGYGHASGCESGGLYTRALHYQGRQLVFGDGQNAFQALRHDALRAVLEEPANQLSGLIPAWVTTSGATVSFTDRAGNGLLIPRRSLGVPQGSPLGSPGYALATEGHLAKAAEEHEIQLRTGFIDDLALGHDDAVFLTDAAIRIFDDLKAATGVTTTHRSLLVASAATMVDNELIGKLNANGFDLRHDGVTHAGVPVGSDEYVLGEFTKIVNKLVAKIDDIATMSHNSAGYDLAACVTMLRLTITPALNFAMRVSNPSLVKAECGRLDGVLVNVLVRMLGLTQGFLALSPAAAKVVRARLHLPLRLGGLGFVRCTDICGLAYLGAMAATVPVVASAPAAGKNGLGKGAFLGDDDEPLEAWKHLDELIVSARAAYGERVVPFENLRALCAEENPILGFQTRLSAAMHKLHALKVTERVVALAAIATTLPSLPAGAAPGGPAQRAAGRADPLVLVLSRDVVRAAKAAATAPEVSGFLSCFAGANGPTAMTDRAFSIAVASYLGVPTHVLHASHEPGVDGTETMRPPPPERKSLAHTACLECSAVLDPGGGHAHTCTATQGARTKGSNALKTVLLRQMSRAGIHASNEPTLSNHYLRRDDAPDDNAFRGDISFTLPGAPGKMYIVDVVVSATTRATTKPLDAPDALVLAAEGAKRTKYDKNFVIPKGSFIPFGAGTNGVLGPSAKALLRTIARAGAEGPGGVKAGTRYRWLCEKVAVVIRAANADRHAIYTAKCVPGQDA